MITLDEFLGITATVLRRNLNDAQSQSVVHSDERNLLIVAGPGSGKTTVLVLRALRYVFVDGELPERLLITTFTRKAAKELRTRWLDWGNDIVAHLRERPELVLSLQRIDLNRCRIDTLDSVAQQVLSEHKLAGELPLEVIEDSTAKLVLKRKAFSEIYSTHQTTLDPFLARYSFDGQPPGNRGDALQIVQSLADRLVQDRVNLGSYAASGPAHQLVVQIAQTYREYLRTTGLLDFASLECLFLERIRNGTLRHWLSETTRILIDEYQDTNPLQEEIYFEIINRANCQVTVVGDDDQAMYRFRGGSVELFTQFATRCQSATGRTTRRLDMVRNYRSAGEIVAFYNSHIRGDAQFSNARITPSKPEVIADRGDLDFPVLGMFRETPEDLAESVAAWLNDVLQSRIFTFSHRGRQHELALSPGNALGDCVLLGHSINEVRYERFNGTAKTLFPGMLRTQMEQRGHHIFNPRGKSLRTVANVQKLLGLLLLALDPTGALTSAESGFNITGEARFYFDQWRGAARELLATHPLSRSHSSLLQFVGDWQRASRGELQFRNANDWPVLEILFKLISWLPEFQNDPEHQVWLEAVTRAFTSASIESAYGMQIHQIEPHRSRSRQTLIRDGLVPIAEDEVAVDEDIMPSVPRNRLQIMTTHQSKGLEFPLVLVDVASGFKTASAQHAFRRFPREESNVARLEDDMESHLQNPLRTGRTALNRTFDDLVRLYYVAYSRPQSVLLLVGCEKCLKYGTGRDLKGAIPHIGMGWLRNGTWPWRQPRPTRGGAPVLVEPPFALIS